MLFTLSIFYNYFETKNHVNFFVDLLVVVSEIFQKIVKNGLNLFVL